MARKVWRIEWTLGDPDITVYMGREIAVGDDDKIGVAQDTSNPVLIPIAESGTTVADLLDNNRMAALDAAAKADRIAKRGAGAGRP